MKEENNLLIFCIFPVALFGRSQDKWIAFLWGVALRLGGSGVGSTDIEYDTESEPYKFFAKHV